MAPRASLKTFLSVARAALSAPPSKRPSPLTFVVGNESADLDSLCSALLLAYFQNRDSGSLHIPLCHLHRADLALRPEFVALLCDAGLDGGDVLTFEDIFPSSVATVDPAKAKTRGVDESLNPVISPDDTRWLLVDHNAMTGILAKVFAHRVIGCVDHHADERVIPRDAEIRVLGKTGSCASLVLERFRDTWGTGPPVRAAAVDDEKHIDSQLARLILGPVLVDTSNLADKTKTTDRDIDAANIAAARITAMEPTFDRDQFFARLSALKEDVDGMSFRDIFRKDFKEWTSNSHSVAGDGTGSLRLGTSSVPQSFSYLVDKKAGGGAEGAAKFLSELGKWAAEKDGVGGVGGVGQRATTTMMDLIVVFTAFKDDEGRFRRELLVWARSARGATAAEIFEKANAEELDLQPWRGKALELQHGKDGEWRKCWVQNSVSQSRKQIAPMLRDAMERVAAGSGG